MFGKMQKIQFTETDTHIGKYELGRQIGSGQHSIVRKCYDLVSFRSYAIKILNDEEGMNQLQVELNAFHQLHPSHPNILTIHDYFVGIKGVYLVMEHSQFDLFDFLEHYHGILDMNICGLIISEISAGLLHMKSRHLTHGDLKPENILVDITKEALVIKLCDFGTCQSTTPGTFLSSVYVGTAGFHSPEVWLTPESYCPYASDIFSLGCIALEIILREVDFLRIWMPCYQSRDDSTAFNYCLSEAIPSVQILIQEAFFLSESQSGRCHPSTEIFQKMIEMSPSHRPILEQIISAELCHEASHPAAIQTLTEGKCVWTRRWSCSETHGSSNSLPSATLMTTTPPLSSSPIKKSFSMKTTQPLFSIFLNRSQTLPNPVSNNHSSHSHSHSQSTRSEVLNLLSGSSCSSSSPGDSIFTNSSDSSLECDDQEGGIETEMNVSSTSTTPPSSPLWEKLFESPASRLITQWAEAQHSKCEQSLQILKNFHTAPPARGFLPNPKPSSLSTRAKATAATPIILRKFPSLPPRCCSSFSAKASSLSPLQRKLSSVS